MKYNLLKPAFVIFIFLGLMSSCAKVNYGGHAVGINTDTAAANQNAKTRNLDGNSNKFVMTEGEVREFQFEFAQELKADTSFVWTLISKSTDVNVSDRFKTVTGSILVKAGQRILNIQISSVAADNIKQGNQDFVIAFTPENAATSLTADLTLLDIQKLPIVSFSQNVVEVDEKNEAYLELQLNEASSEPVVVEVNLINGTALRHRDYNGFKTPSPNSEAQQVVIFAPNVLRVSLPVVGVRMTDICDVEFYAKINKFNLKMASVQTEKAKIYIPCRESQPAPTPIVAPTPTPKPELPPSVE